MKRSYSNWKQPRIDDEPILEKVIRENEIVEKEMMIDNGIIVYTKIHNGFSDTEKYIRINPNMEKEVIEYNEEHYYILWKRELKEKCVIQIRIVKGHKEYHMEELEYDLMYHLEITNGYILFYLMKEEKYNRMRNYVIENEIEPMKKSESSTCLIYLDTEYQTDQTGKKMIKRLKKDNEYMSVRSFIYEMKIYEELEMNPHPNICRMFGKKIIEDEEGSIFPGMVLEQGLDLRNTVVALDKRYEEMGKMKEYYFKMENLIDQMIMGIRYFHQLGYIHFDIKLENFIFVNGVVKLIDFGQSEKKNTIQMNRIRYKGTKGFTPIEIKYMKPSYQNNIDERVDIWSLGICILTMLGRDAYHYKILNDIKDVMYYVNTDGQDRMNKIIMNMLEEYENITGHGNEIRELIYLMMKVDPKERTKLQNIRIPIVKWNIV